MNPRSAIQKGKELENYTADQINLKGLDTNARRSSGSGNGNREKADVDTNMMVLGRNAGIECKNYKNAHVQEWWDQAKKLEVLGKEPIVVYKLQGESLGEAKAIIYLDTLLDLIKRSTEPKTAKTDNQRLQWLLRSLNKNAKAVLDEIQPS